MEKTQTVLVAIVILAVAIVAGCYYIGSDNTNDDTEKELEGYWYQVNYNGYMGDDYVALDPTSTHSFAYDFNLDIRESKNGVFYGYMHDELISGSYSDKILFMNGTIDGTTTWMNGMMKGNILFVTFIQSNSDGISSYYTAYSKDTNAKVDISNSIDITGDWKTYEKYCLNKDGIRELSGENLTVTKQSGNVFIGNMELFIGGSVTKTDFVGVLIEGNGCYNGYLLCNDEFWTATVDNGMFRLNTAQLDNTGMSDSLPTVYERSYSRDGSPITEDYTELVDTEWTMTSLYWPWSISNGTSADRIIIKEYIEYVYVFTAQEGALLTGHIEYGGLTYDVVAYLHGQNRITTIENFTIDGLVYSTGAICDDTFDLSCTADSAGTVNFTSFVKTDGSERAYDGKITGHWYSVSTSSSILEERWYFLNKERENLIPLEINTEDQDGLVTGYFGSTPFSGIHKGSKLWFSTIDNDGTTIRFDGTFNSDGTLITAVETYTYSDGHIDVRCGTYCTESDSAIAHSYLDIDGDWTSAEGDSVRYEYVVEEISGSTLSLTTDSEIITGTISEIVDGRSVTRDVYGIGLMTDDRITGYLASDSDELWKFEYENGVLVLDRVYDTGFTYVVEQRVYTQDGEDPFHATTVDLEDTVWRSTVNIKMDAFGNKTTLDPTTLTIDSQYENLVTGIIDVGNMLGFRGFIFNDEPCLLETLTMENTDYSHIMIDGDKLVMSMTTVRNGVSTVYWGIFEKVDA